MISIRSIVLTCTAISLQVQCADATQTPPTVGRSPLSQESPISIASCPHARESASSASSSSSPVALGLALDHLVERPHPLPSREAALSDAANMVRYRRYLSNTNTMEWGDEELDRLTYLRDTAAVTGLSPEDLCEAIELLKQLSAISEACRTRIAHDEPGRWLSHISNDIETMQALRNRVECLYVRKELHKAIEQFENSGHIVIHMRLMTHLAHIPLNEYDRLSVVKNIQSIALLHNICAHAISDRSLNEKETLKKLTICMQKITTLNNEIANIINNAVTVFQERYPTHQIRELS